MADGTTVNIIAIISSSSSIIASDWVWLITEPVRCCGCHNISDLLHNAFCGFTVHGDVPCLIEVVKEVP